MARLYPLILKNGKPTPSQVLGIRDKIYRKCPLILYNQESAHIHPLEMD